MVNRQRQRSSHSLSTVIVLKLLASILIDIIGVISYIIPGIGETVDAIWAPISGSLVYWLYGSPVWGSIATLEEALPFTDFIPTATLAWLYEYAKRRRQR